MYLTALEIQGFKSFPDRTKVAIGKGITAVVGPNGSGKSNISDAIRWVLGETSAKQLRGGGKMENVIFGGTQQRGAMGYALVNLHVNNIDRRLDVDNDEVIIGRKYYRSGDSEYSINGQNVRLKDIYELLLDTGLGRDGYSVVGQGRVAEIVGAKSAERREIFEEASGIAKYRYRKNEAERRLSSAEENLVRLRDILSELERQVGPLEKESEKAKVYLELASQRKELEVTLWVDTISQAKETLREQQRKIEIANTDYANATNAIETLENEACELRTQQERCIMEMNRLQDDITAVNEEIAGADTRIAVLKNNIEHNNESIATMQKELDESEEGQESIATEVLHHKAQIKACEEQLAQLEDRKTSLETTLNELQSQSAQSGEKRGFITEKLTQMTTRITDLKVKCATAKSVVETAKARLQTTKLDAQQSKENTKQLESEKQEANSFLQETLNNLKQLENIKEGLSLKLNGRKKVLEDADTKEQELVRSIENSTQRIQVLKDLERSMDGYQGSVKTIMKAAESHRLRGIIGPVASILSVKAGYELAVETALGFALQNIVVENETSAKFAMAMLKDERAGRATFLPLTTMKAGFFNGRLTGSAIRASEIVDYDKRFENVVLNLLGRIIIVDDINEATSVARALDYKNRIVTKDGQIINAGGSFTGGSVSRSSGMFSRKQEIEELGEKIKKLTGQCEKAQQDTDNAKQEVDAITAELTATESEMIVLGGDKIRCEAELSRINSVLSQALNMGAVLKDECDLLQKQIEENLAILQAGDAEAVKLENDSINLENELANISGDDDTFLETRNRLAQEISQTRLSSVTAQKDIENHEHAIAILNSQTGNVFERNENLKLSIQTLALKNEEYEQSILNVQNVASTSKERIAQLRSKIEQSGTLRLEKEGEERNKNQEAKRRIEEREKISREIARLTEQKESKDAEYEQTVAKLWEEYELTVQDAQGLCVNFDSSAELRRDVLSVRAKIKNLGNVNVNAIEEYAQVSTRYEFMRTQVGDVEQSKKELINLITSLSDEMRTMFTESFAQINANFKRIFVELFGGGNAQLSLESDVDVLESGINIDVAPPGKIIKNLSALSGGEQSLVAISIYFAILAVNPAPFCVLDEIEAALDDVNVTRYAQYLRRISDQTQFIVITHRRGTMEEADVLYGVTMQEDGVSKLLKLDVSNVDASLIK